MTQPPRSENSSLRAQVRELVERARANERISKRLQKTELEILGATSLVQLVEVLIRDLSEAGGRRVTTLMLHDPEYEIRRILEAEGDAVLRSGGVRLVEDVAYIHDLFPDSSQPFQGLLEAKASEFLFGDQVSGISSVLVLPLIRRSNLIGCVALGSFDQDEFSEDIATDILERLAAIVAVGVEYTVNVHRLEKAGLVDPLTGVNNRRFFDQRLGEEFSRAMRNVRPLSCLMVDVDHFKRINDQYGHQVGDRILIGVAEVLMQQMRNTDVLARYGGEEFVVLLPETQESLALEVAERLRTAVAAGSFSDAVSVTVSVGLAVMSGTENATTAEQLIANADKALYQAKRQGRNRVVQY